MKPCCAESYAEYRDMTDREEYEELVSGILSMSATDSGIVSVGETVVREKRKKDSGETEAEKEPSTKKRRVSPYYWFFEEQRVSLKKENPEMTNTMVHKLLREVWDKMSENEKKRLV